VRKTLILILATLFVLALLSFTMFYTVRFTEAAVLTTFGKAGENAVKHEAGINFKLPYPIQSVTTYDTRLRVLPMKLETQLTADSRQITVEGFVTWRVKDPLKFFQRFSNAGERAEDHYAAAQTALQANFRSSLGLVGRYRMDELFTEKPEGSKLPQLEQLILDGFRQASDKSGLSLADYGIEASSVGISRVVLPESTTAAVFEAMKSRRDVYAKETQSQGEAQAAAIKSRAEQDAKRILAFAERRAAEIRELGERESAPFLAQMSANPELAVFLKQMEFVGTLVSKRTTVVLPTSLPGVDALSPEYLKGLKPGQLPIAPFAAPKDEAVKAGGGK
jgi:membrane protease subunit HflC